MDLRIRGKTALITGGSRGIGLGVAKLLAEEGCNLHLVSRSQGNLDAARQAILAGHKVEVTCHAADLADSAAASGLARRLKDVDILVNNAGSIPQGSLAKMDDAALQASWSLKLFGFLNMAREVYTAMCERRAGVIVNVIGASGDRPRADYISGSMANAALIAMSRALGAEAPSYGVRVVGLNPAATETERQRVRWEARAQKELGDSSRWRELTGGYPFGRLATVDEIASAIVFLVSGRASYISGTVLTVDGGRSFRDK
ncbi:MAG: SDR family oxidoreductase [Burkholderiales bacterium]|nr:SDR family oxidoreductase [Burkholderiales bacterium]